jgi:hypothetical protein
MFAHLFGGGTLMKTSLSHLKAQIIVLKTWMQIKAHD